MIALRRDYLNFSRQAEQKIGKLKEVIEAINQGKDVDVEEMLGTGDPEREKEWEEGELEQPCTLESHYSLHRQQSYRRSS